MLYDPISMTVSTKPSTLAMKNHYRSVCSGGWVGRDEWIPRAHVMELCLGAHEHVLERVRSDACITLQIDQTPLDCTRQRLNFTTYGVGLHSQIHVT